MIYPISLHLPFLLSFTVRAHLRTALDLTSASQDNHLRALIIALISSHYFHTARNHAENMLLTSEQLAAGMGAQPRRPSSNISTGKLPLATSDKVNAIQKDPNTEIYDTAKPRSKRKAGEDENDTPSLQPLKGKTDLNEYSQMAEATGNAQLRLWISERFLGTYYPHVMVIFADNPFSRAQPVGRRRGESEEA